LRICSQARSREPTRSLPILLIADLEDRQKVLRGLDLGVNDYLNRPIDRNELLARARTNILQKRYADRLRETVRQSIEMALYDPLTGLNNRRFLEIQLPAMIETARQRQTPLTLMILDIDHFKQVNDRHGHGAGDEVLKGFAARLLANARGGDLLCRLGGEEFVSVMPGVAIDQAFRIAERTRQSIERQAFPTGGAGGSIPLTVSIGLAGLIEGCDAGDLYRRADRALYRAKSQGRNRVTEDAA
jgi:two-component system, cell cycle response regulator